MTTDYRSILEELGYPLADHGNHWRTRAVYRNGRTATSVIIYKDTGVWRDFGSECKPQPFESLVKKTLKTDNLEILSKYCNLDKEAFRPYVKKDKLEMEKIYDKAVLEKLLPSHDFYENKRISAGTQKAFQCGLASSGRLYHRIVFPIFNLNGEIHGFSGRSVINPSSGKEVPKWKHIGQRRNWLYPHHLSSNHIEAAKEVILVESIGDAMALHEKGYKNVLCTFGLKISHKLLGYLNSFELDRIIVAGNNDGHKEENTGALAAIENFASLCGVFDYNVPCYNIATEQDFGHMIENELDFNSWYSRTSKWTLDNQNFREWILGKIENHDKLANSKPCQNLIKLIKEINDD
jgi:hypothetical protein